MLTIEDLESSCDASQNVELPKHAIEGPDLLLQRRYDPFGFPLEVRTNCEDVLTQYDELWGKFERQQNTVPIQVDVQVVNGSSTECPPEPSYRLMGPLMITAADADNYSIVDLERAYARITISRAALRHRLYAQYFLLGTPVCCIATRYATPVHAGCVALDGKGILLCGDSGAGKSTLSYACARAGWTYVTDDASFLLNGGEGLLVTGDCHKVRFRPTAAEIFPELAGLELTPRAAGKPSIELPTAPMTNMARTQTTKVKHVVFLNRRREGPPELVPYRKDVARQFMRQTLFGPIAWRNEQNRAIEQLLHVGVFELRYSSLDWAIDRLQTLVREGR
jgi:hypothetical protein